MSDKYKQNKVSILVKTKKHLEEIEKYLILVGYSSNGSVYFRNKNLLDTYIWINKKEKSFCSADNHSFNFVFNFEGVDNDFKELVALDKNMKKLDIKKDKIAIKIGDSKILKDFIEKLYFSKEIKWRESGSIPPSELKNTCLALYSDGFLTYCDDLFYKEKGYVIFDAETQMGEIVALFEEPEIKIPEIHGYKAKYEKDSLFVCFGCAEISLSFLKKIINLSEQTLDAGNREISGVILDSGKILNLAQIKEIITYTKAINSK